MRDDKPRKFFLIHGIRDNGEWQDEFTEYCKESESFRYERFWIEKFLTHRLFMQGIIGALRARLIRATKENDITVVCHSFGTHLLTQLLYDNEDI
ncbi:MAG: hypothetical protein AAF709_09135, partial [Pseudomonadota bacterium]